MTLTTTERLVVDGVDLKTLARNIESLGALMTGAGKRGSNVPVAQRSGALYTGLKPHDIGSFVLKGWVIGTDDNGAVPGGSTARREFYKRVDEMTALFGGHNGQLVFQHTLPDGSVRQCAAEALGGVTFDTYGADPTGIFSVAFEIPEAFWEDPTVGTWSAAPGTQIVIPNATAPCDDAQLVFKGPGTPVITDSTGAVFTYNATLTSTQTLTINCDTFTVVGGGGLTADYGKVSFNGNTMGRLFRMGVRSGMSLGYGVTLSGTGTTTASLLTVNCQRKYMVG